MKTTPSMRQVYKIILRQMDQKENWTWYAGSKDGVKKKNQRVKIEQNSIYFKEKNIDLQPQPNNQHLAAYYTFANSDDDDYNRRISIYGILWRWRFNRKIQAIKNFTKTNKKKTQEHDEEEYANKVLIDFLKE